MADPLDFPCACDIHRTHYVCAEGCPCIVGVTVKPKRLLSGEFMLVTTKVRVTATGGSGDARNGAGDA